MKARINHIRILVFATFVVAASPAVSSAQMFAVYADNAPDVAFEYMFGASSYWQDPAAGCNHINEVLTTTLSSPSFAQNQGSDFAALPFNYEEGYWETEGVYTANCDCVFWNPVETSDIIGKFVSLHISANIAPVIPFSDSARLCYYGDFWCSAGSPTCGHAEEAIVFSPPGSDCWFAIACRWVRSGGHCFQPILQNCWEIEDPVVCT